MTNPAAAPIHLARHLRFVVWLTMVMLPCATLAAWASPETIRTLIVPRLLPSQSVSITHLAQGLSLLVTLVPLSVALLALFTLDRLFRLYGRGQALAADAARHLRRVAQCVLALGLMGPPLHAALSLLFSMGNPPGQRFVSITISSSDVGLAILGGLLLALAVVMEQAAALAEDHAAIV